MSPTESVSRRRATTCLVAASLAGFSGCLTGPRSQPGGALTLSNGDTEDHTVLMRVVKGGTSRDGIPNGSGGGTVPTPRPDPAWERRHSYDVEGEDERRVDGFIDEPGAFYIEARLRGEEPSATWLGLHRGEGGRVGGGEGYVSVNSDGVLTLPTPNS